MWAPLLTMLLSVNKLIMQQVLSQRFVYALELPHILMLTYNTETHGRR